MRRRLGMVAARTDGGNGVGNVDHGSNTGLMAAVIVAWTTDRSTEAAVAET